MSLEDDYDPTRPNDYDDYKEYEKRRRENELHQLQEEYKRRRSETPERDRRSPPRYNPASSVHSSLSPSSQMSDVTDEPTIPRPPPVHIDLDITGEEAYLRRARLTNTSVSVEPPSKKSPTPSMASQGSGEDFAHRMLSKYGWQEGQGLGKSEQGISEPLMVQKTDARTAVIVDNSSAKADQRPVPKTNVDAVLQENAPQEFMSRVILLTNMVGPGEVDDTLQEETADECNEKYGTVERCLIFEVPNGKLPDDEAVRIFVKFVGQEAAMKAKQDLNGRFFGGRAVTARFFDEARFDKLDLAPSPIELQRAKESHGS